MTSTQQEASVCHGGKLRLSRRRGAARVEEMKAFLAFAGYCSSYSPNSSSASLYSSHASPFWYARSISSQVG